MEHIQVQAPVVSKPGNLQIGKVYDLSFGKRRFSQMAEEWITSFAASNDTTPIIDGYYSEQSFESMPNPPMLIHACSGRLQPGQLACLVQVVWCRLHRGTTDLQLLPVAWVKLSQVKSRIQSDEFSSQDGWIANKAYRI